MADATVIIVTRNRKQLAARAVESALSQRGSPEVLVIDDDPTVRAVTARMVEACGFDVLQAVDGLHGVEVFSQKQNDIRAVVLDMTMPKLAIASKPAVRETALLMPDAMPARLSLTEFMTVVVNGATLIAMPRPSTTIAGKNPVQ